MNVRIDHPTNRPNFTEATIGDLTIWYSYATPIAYHTPGAHAVRENIWGPTTGRHICYVEREWGTSAPRTPGEQFEAQLNAITSRLTVAPVQS